jgi:phosphatidylinositol glycan class W
MKQLVIRPEPFSPECLSAGSIIMEATNVNFLGVFIISNLLVGLVNNTMRTLDISDVPATIILSIYMLANCAIAVSLKKTGIQLKVW